MMCDDFPRLSSTRPLVMISPPRTRKAEEVCVTPTDNKNIGFVAVSARVTPTEEKTFEYQQRDTPPASVSFVSKGEPSETKPVSILRKSSFESPPLTAVLSQSQEMATQKTWAPGGTVKPGMIRGVQSAPGGPATAPKPTRPQASQPQPVVVRQVQTQQQNVRMQTTQQQSAQQTTQKTTQQATQQTVRVQGAPAVNGSPGQSAPQTGAPRPQFSSVQEALKAARTGASSPQPQSAPSQAPASVSTAVTVVGQAQVGQPVAIMVKTSDQQPVAIQQPTPAPQQAVTLVNRSHSDAAVVQMQTARVQQPQPVMQVQQQPVMTQQAPQPVMQVQQQPVMTQQAPQSAVHVQQAPSSPQQPRPAQMQQVPVVAQPAVQQPQPPPVRVVAFNQQPILATSQQPAAIPVPIVKPVEEDDVVQPQIQTRVHAGPPTAVFPGATPIVSVSQPSQSPPPPNYVSSTTTEPPQELPFTLEQLLNNLSSLPLQSLVYFVGLIFGSALVAMAIGIPPTWMIVLIALSSFVLFHKLSI